MVFYIRKLSNCFEFDHLVDAKSIDTKIDIRKLLDDEECFEFIYLCTHRLSGIPHNVRYRIDMYRAISIFITKSCPCFFKFSLNSSKIAKLVENVLFRENCEEGYRCEKEREREWLRHPIQT